MWCLFPATGMCFFACKHFLLADTFARAARFYRFFLHQMRSKRDGNVSEKTWRTILIITPVLLGLSTQFKKLYIVWRPRQYIKSEPRLTEAPSRCNVILNQSHDWLLRVNSTDLPTQSQCRTSTGPALFRFPMCFLNYVAGEFAVLFSNLMLCFLNCHCVLQLAVVICTRRPSEDRLPLCPVHCLQVDDN